MKKLILSVFIASLVASSGFAQGQGNIKRPIDEFIGEGMKNAIKNGRIKQIEWSDGLPFLSGAKDVFALFLSSKGLARLQNAALIARDINQLAYLSVKGDNNMTSITQIGSYNVGVIMINGNSNDASLYQNGSSLFSFIKIKGDKNILDVDQTGTALQHLIILEGSGVNFDILQNNQGVTLIQKGGNSPAPIIIRRNSGRVPIIIKNSRNPFY